MDLLVLRAFVKHASLGEDTLEDYRATRAAVITTFPKLATWSWKGFKEGLADEGIPLAGATAGAGLGRLAQMSGRPGLKNMTSLTGAALGYAAGSGASMLRAKLRGDTKGPSTAQRVLAMSGLGYGMGGIAHAGASALAARGVQRAGVAGAKAPGMLRKAFAPEAMHELGHNVSRGTHALGSTLEEALPAAAATGMTGAALATEKKKHQQEQQVRPQ